MIIFLPNSKSKKLSLYKIRKEIYKYYTQDLGTLEIKYFQENKEPKISLIITLFNQVEYVLKTYFCIINQSLEDIEIIFIDDASKDNPFEILKTIMNKDKRIKLLKNKVNRGQFYSRNKAVLSSKGEYVIIVDPDDLLLNDILIKSYNIAKKFDLDIVQFYHLMGNFKKNELIIINRFSGIYSKAKTNNVFFNYDRRYLWDKLIRRSVFIKSIYFMDKKYRKERFIIHNDETACFGIFKSACSYAQIEEVGYFYYWNNINSTTKKNFLPKNINGRFHSIFAIMEYYYEKSANNTYEKVRGGYHFFEYRIIRKYERKIPFLTKGFTFINKVINKYKSSPFYNSTHKSILQSFQDKINIQNIKIKKKKKLKKIENIFLNN